jgi:predicted lipoprotein with Yx(FWY)xxD motif
MRHLLRLSLLPAIASSLLLVACGSTSTSTTKSANGAQPAAQTSAASSGVVVKTASNPTLGAILVNGRGMTLYHLSAEQSGKFICTTSACLGVWHPLVASSAGRPGGVESLSTIKRPDGTIQVTYMGMPLYTFAQDQQPGETNGQGIKDVGTWSAATSASSAGTSTSPTSSTSTSAPAESSGEGGGYHY